MPHEQPRMPSDDDEFPLAVLEDDEDIPPRPEEEIADLERAEPAPARRPPAADR